MKNPPAHDHPDRMTSQFYTCTALDSGGVHTNSGVGNKAAFLIVDGGTFNGFTVQGIGLAKAAKVYYETETHLLLSGSDYADLADALAQACAILQGTSGITLADCQEVKKAVLAVEMDLSPLACPAPEAPLRCGRPGHPLLRRHGERKRQLDDREGARGRQQGIRAGSPPG